MKEVFSFNWDCGRNGNIEGLFISTDEEVAKLIGKRVYFGKILGRHSEVFGPVEENDIYPIDLSESTVEELYRVIGRTISGYNPFDYIDEEEET